MSLRSSAADPLRLAAGGAEPNVATSDTFCRTVDASAGSPFPRSPPVTRLSSRDQLSTTPGPRMPSPRLEVTPRMNPRCLRRLEARPLDRVKQSAIPLTFARNPQHPFARNACARFVMKIEPPSLATSRSLGHAFRPNLARGKKMLPRRPLQPTYATSTREPFEVRARSSRCADREEGRRPFDRSNSLAGAGPPCGDPTSAGEALDGAASFRRFTHVIPLAFGQGEMRAGTLAGATVSRWAFSARSKLVNGF